MSLLAASTYQTDHLPQAQSQIIKYLISALFLLSALLMRPTLFGQTATTIGLVLMAATVFGYFALVKQPFIMKRDDIWILALAIATILFWVYCFSGAMILGKSNNDFVFKATIAGTFTSVAFFLLLKDREINRTLFYQFASLNALLGWSILITTILLLFIPETKLIIGQLTIEGYDEIQQNGKILFPFSPIYGFLTEYGLTRFLAIYRESGIAQFFLLWSTLYLLYASKNWFLVLGALAGGALVMSTSFIVTSGLAFALYVLSTKKLNILHVLLLLLGFVLFVLAAIYTPGIGLADKAMTHSTSIDDRLFAISYGIDQSKSILFGNGLYYKYTSYGNIGINALGSVYGIGVLGLMLYLFLFSIYLITPGFDKNARKYVTLVSPLFITSLIFQPLMDAPLAYMLLFCIPPDSSSACNSLLSRVRF